MICECPTCGAALMFDPESGKMKCGGCGNLYEGYEPDRVRSVEGTGPLSVKQTGEEPVRRITYSQDAGKNEEPLQSAESDDRMECKVYTCTACGAEIYVNDVEVSKFCAYCGQPTVIYNRVSSARKPKYIIPFAITQDKALSIIRNRLSKGFFIPQEIRNFELERVRGIYIPFWLYDIHYHDSEYLRGEVGSGKSKRTCYYFREAEGDFCRITLDASKQLNDESSQRLEPYNLEDLKEFQLSYLSGFYADSFDMDTRDLNGLAIQRAKEMFEDEVKKTVSASDVQVLKREPRQEIRNTEYAMFPAWFLTFRYEGNPYTMLINGQTGKLIGGLPYDRKKEKTCKILFGILFSVCAIFFAYFMLIDSEDAGEVLKSMMALGMIGGVMSITAHGVMEKVKASTKLTSLSETNRFVKDR